MMAQSLLVDFGKNCGGIPHKIRPLRRFPFREVVPKKRNVAIVAVDLRVHPAVGDYPKFNPLAFFVV